MSILGEFKDDFADGVEQLAKDAKNELTKAGIKIALDQKVPPEMREHLPKLIDASAFLLNKIKDWMKKGGKHVLLLLDPEDNIRLIAVDTSKPHMISNEENHWTALPWLGSKDDLGVNIDEAREQLVKEFVLPLIPEQFRADIGKLDEEGIKQGFEKFKEHIAPVVPNPDNEAIIPAAPTEGMAEIGNKQQDQLPDSGVVNESKPSE